MSVVLDGPAWPRHAPCPDPHPTYCSVSFPLQLFFPPPVRSAVYFGVLCCPLLVISLRCSVLCVCVCVSECVWAVFFLPLLYRCQVLVQIIWAPHINLHIGRLRCDFLFLNKTLICFYIFNIFLITFKQHRCLNKTAVYIFSYIVYQELLSESNTLPVLFGACNFFIFFFYFNFPLAVKTHWSLC